MKVEQQKEELLQRITPLFLEYGYQKLTMAQMAKSLSVSTKKLHQVFGTKEKLIKEVLAFRMELFIGMGEKIRRETKDALQNFIVFRKTVDEIVPEDQQRINLLELQSINEKLYVGALQDLRVINSVCFEMIHRRGVEEEIFTSKFSSEDIGKSYADLFIQLRTMSYKSWEEYQQKVNLSTQIFMRGLVTPKGLQLFETYQDQFDVL